MSEITNKKRVMALSSLQRRAGAGDVDARATLGRALARGELGPPDRIAAWVQLTRAAAAGHSGATADLVALAREIEDNDRAEAEAALAAG